MRPKQRRLEQEKSSRRQMAIWDTEAVRPIVKFLYIFVQITQTKHHSKYIKLSSFIFIPK